MDEGKAAETWQEVADHIRGLLERRGANIQSLDKWDTCRLAYEIQGKKRGTYVLSHFDMNPSEIDELRRDCQLSPIVMRSMILRMENVGQSLEAAEEAIRARRRAKGLAEEPPAPQPAAGEAAQPAAVEPVADELATDESDIIGDVSELEPESN